MSTVADKPTCPYCGSKAVLIDSKEIYGRSYGPAWACAMYPKCDAYVGCHPRTTIPLGRLSDRRLRQAKNRAHKAFDRLWRNGSMSRKESYVWLQERLGMTADECHIGMFDVGDCERVVMAVENFANA